ncbi:16467_t:CDS:2, partial [Cetraspora pellucida]
KATSGTAAAVIFNNDPLLSATLTLNNKTFNTINLDAPCCAIQAEDINLNGQPSDISLEIGFVNMDIQESNAQDRKLSFNVDDDTQGHSKNKAQNLNSNNQEPIEFESDEYDDTDEKRDEIIFDVLTSSLGKSKKTSSAKSSTYKFQDNTAKHKSKTNEMFKVAKKYDKDDNHGGIKCIPSTLIADSPLPSKKNAASEQSFTTKNTSKEASASSSKSWQPNKNDMLSIVSIIDNQSDVGNIENERTSIINKKNEVSAQEMESSFDVEDGTVDGLGVEVSQINNEVNNDSQSDSDPNNEINK